MFRTFPSATRQQVGAGYTRHGSPSMGTGGLGRTLPSEARDRELQRHHVDRRYGPELKLKSAKMRC